MPMRLIPNAELRIFPNSGHWVMIEAKEAFERAVIEFLSRLTGSRVARAAQSVDDGSSRATGGGAPSPDRRWISAVRLRKYPHRGGRAVQVRACSEELNDERVKPAQARRSGRPGGLRQDGSERDVDRREADPQAGRPGRSQSNAMSTTPHRRPPPKSPDRRPPRGAAAQAARPNATRRELDRLRFRPF